MILLVNTCLSKIIMFLELRELHRNGAIRGYQLGAEYHLPPILIDKMLVFFDDLNFKIVKVNCLDKAVLAKSRFGMTFKIGNI